MSPVVGATAALLADIQQGADNRQHEILHLVLKKNCELGQKYVALQIIRDELSALVAMIDYWSLDDQDRYEELLQKEEKCQWFELDLDPCGHCNICCSLGW